MTELIIDLYRHDFNPNVEAESVEAALGQFIAQQGMGYRSVHVQGKAAYVEFADDEGAEEALAALDEKRNITRQSEHVITMPSFIVDSNIDGRKYFRKVRRNPFFIKSFS